MFSPILFGDTPENFYQRLGEFIQKTIQQELSSTKKQEEENYIQKPEVVKILRVTDPTIDSHVRKGFYKKYEIGARVLYNKQEILDYIKQTGKSGKNK